MASVRNIPTIPGELFTKFQTGFYAAPVDTVFETLGVQKATMTKHGYEQHEWDEAKDEMQKTQIEQAKVRGMIPNSELVEKITAIELELNPLALAAMLGEVSTEKRSADRGMLSVIVVHKVGDMQPGPGFFE